MWMTVCHLRVNSLCLSIISNFVFLQRSVDYINYSNNGKWIWSNVDIFGSLVSSLSNVETFVFHHSFSLNTFDCFWMPIRKKTHFAKFPLVQGIYHSLFSFLTELQRQGKSVIPKNFTEKVPTVKMDYHRIMFNPPSVIMHSDDYCTMEQYDRDKYIYFAPCVQQNNFKFVWITKQ